jgi:predicted CXXCH cytochrome family protein
MRHGSRIGGRGRAAALVSAVVGLGLAAPAPGQGQAPATASCLECHGVAGERPAGQAADGTSIFLGDWDRSVHAGLECVDCHTGITASPHDTPVPPAQCASCHETETAIYARSSHGARHAAGDSLAPSCAACHDPHAVRPSGEPESILHRARVAQVCTGCHSDEHKVGTGGFAVPHPAQSYHRGAHAQAVAEGNLRAATCGDCHDSHAVRPAQDPESAVFRQNIPETCGGCHADEFAAYRASTHGKAVARGSSDSPVCSTCHGEHAVLRLGEPGATTVVASETCESCHGSAALARRYDLPQGAVTSYEDSYHGRAARGGLAQAAGCVSCHGVHRILEAADPESSIHPANLQATCSGCHAGATQSFASSYAHGPRGATAGDRGAGIVRNIYVWLILLVIGGMALHNGIVLWHDLRQRYRAHRVHAVHERLDRNERRQHTALLVSFALLVLTGFALRYSDSSWARALAAIGLDEEARRILHRGAAVLMILTSIVHAVWLFTGRGREQLREMAPRADDLRQALGHLRWLLGRSSTRPAFGRFRYIEKAEYWALVWGTAVMVGTGLLLWFPERLSGPAWLVKVAEAVHLYEAWLAFLAIVVWHLFFVLMRPGWEGSFTALHGRMSLEELAHEHPEEYARQYGRHPSRDKIAAAVPEDAPSGSNT